MDNDVSATSLKDHIAAFTAAELPTPGTFVLDRSGVVRLAHVDPDYTRRLEPAAILMALRGIQS